MFETWHGAVLRLQIWEYIPNSLGFNFKQKETAQTALASSVRLSGWRSDEMPQRVMPSAVQLLPSSS